MAKFVIGPVPNEEKPRSITLKQDLDDVNVLVDDKLAGYFDGITGKFYVFADVIDVKVEG